MTGVLYLVRGLFRAIGQNVCLGRACSPGPDSAFHLRWLLVPAGVLHNAGLIGSESSSACAGVLACGV